MNRKLRERARRLRVEERLSYKEITARLGVPKSTLSGWLSDIPLTPEEVRQRKSSNPNRYRAPKKDRGPESKFHKDVSESRLTKHQKAKLAEIAALFRMTLHGMTVFGSSFDGDVADWVIEVDGSFQKVQVKWAQRQREGLPHVPVQRKKGHAGFQTYKEGDFDVLVAYDYFTDICYVWTWEEVKGHASSVTIHPAAAEKWDKLRS